MHHSFTTFAEFQRYPEAALSYRSDGRTLVPATSIEGLAPAGSITSTIEDMARWVQMLTNKGVFEGKPFLAPEQFAYLTSPLTVRNAAEEIFYGIGWDIDTKRRIIYHDGRTAGQSSRILLMPQEGFGIVILCNQQSELQNLLIRYATNIFIDDTYAKMPDFEAFVASKAAQKSPSPIKPSSVRLDNVARQELKSCVGTYTHPAYGVLTLASAPKNQFSFAYYDFQGLVTYTAGAGFSALTQHVTGPDTFPFTIVKDASQQVTGVAVQFPYAQPVLFTKVKDTETAVPARPTSLP
ncbi:beta-lactamase family protein (plasmid) [Hymenobacter volaticus]|uniref:Beta-lactamase family protein n=1 Tax=Hymenobacter volaticus TaxID=2932254 RepID=A0ABY4GE56_9BACT|nr:serine hydrolase domain-containing protein [Hymenobacter volaticus]UOQ69208.1 beta-lactamase family protein [Hymenobacter volaticus]